MITINIQVHVQRELS